MRRTRLRVEWEMTVRRLGRNRVALLLLVLVPAILFTVVMQITPRRASWVEMASVPAEVIALPGLGPVSPGAPGEHGVPVRALETSLGLVFVGLAAVGVLASFVGLSLLQRSWDASRRLVLCGYRTWEILAARTAALLCVSGAVALGVAAALPAFFEPERLGPVAGGLLLLGLVYGAYGLLVGALFRDQLVGVLLIVMLAVVDVGWLQHPVYYADAPAKLLIRALPGYLPAQVAFVGAFTGYPVWRQAVAALAYGTGLLLLAALAFALRMRVRRPARNGDTGDPGPHHERPS